MLFDLYRSAPKNPGFYMYKYRNRAMHIFV
jgi:hypothetical protein